MGAASGVLAAELAAPLLLLCWLCCWPDDGTDSSSSGHPRKPVITSGGAQRLSLRARLAGSAVSLHLPGPSGSPRLPAHRSHEDLSSARHHSAPSVIHEVLHRRDWDHSSRDLYIPLRPPSLPSATPPPCKKHHSNIKCSRKEQRPAAERDQESPSGFYIGDVEDKPPYPEKGEKQTLNESIRCAERPWQLPSPPTLTPLAGLMTPLAAMDDAALSMVDGADRSGAVHHALDSRAAALGYARIAIVSPISVDVVGYEYASPEEAERPVGLQPRAAGEGGRAAVREAGEVGREAGEGRSRVASDGDILAPAPRPESGAFSESDVELELRLALRSPPTARRETAI